MPYDVVLALKAWRSLVALGHFQEVFTALRCVALGLCSFRFGYFWPFSVVLCLATSLLDFAGYLFWLLLALHKKCSGLAMLLPLDSAGLWFSAALGRVQEVLFRDVVAPGLRGQFVHVSSDLVLRTCGPPVTLAADGYRSLAIDSPLLCPPHM